MFNNNTKIMLGSVEFTVKDSDPYTQTNLVRFRRIDPDMPSTFEMFLTDDQLVSLGQAITNHTKETV